MAIPKNALYIAGEREGIKDVPQGIKNFLRRKGVESKNTLEAYTKDINDFFMAMHMKEIDELTVYDLIFEREDIETYQTFLKNENYNGASVNRKVATIRSLFNHFQSNNYFYYNTEGRKVMITGNMFTDLDNLSTNDSEGSGMLYDNEVKMMLEKAKSLPNGVEKSLALELLSVTSFRVDSIVKLKFSNFRNEKGTWIIRIVEKQKVNEKPIRTDLYERIVNENNKRQDLMYDNDKVFSFKSTKTIDRTVDELVKLCGIEVERKITPHSFKKYGMYEVFLITNGNFEEVANQGNHSSYETSQKYYLQFRKDFSAMPCLMIGQEIDFTKFEEMSKEDILNLIKNSSRGVQFQLLSQIK